MHLNITGHHVEVTPAIRSYVEEKLGKLGKHCDHLSKIHVVLTIEKSCQRAEATVRVDQHDLFAVDEQADLYRAIDSLVNKLDRQLLRHREKITNHR